MGSTSNGIRRLFKSFRYAINGLKEMLKTEQNARVHLVVTVCVLMAGGLFSISWLEWCIILICIALVWAAEAFNTAVEAITDHLIKERNENARIIKDVSAGAVFVCALVSAVCVIIIFLPRLLDWLS